MHMHTYIQYKQNTDMLQMYVCVCIFGSIHTSYIQPVLHTYTYKHAGSLMGAGTRRVRRAAAAAAGGGVAGPRGVWGGKGERKGLKLGAHFQVFISCCS